MSAGLPEVLLVTGTDTGVGKTVVTAALAATLGARSGAASGSDTTSGRGATVAVLKPAQTGVGPLEPGDADEVRRLSGASVHEGARLREPLAPTTAARLEGASLPSVAEHAETVHRLASGHDRVLVEGAGGLLVGLDLDGATLADLAVRLEVSYAFVVVVRAGLGTLNHSALTVEALRHRGLPVLGTVIGAMPERPGLAERTNLDDLVTATGLPVLGRVPERAGTMARGPFLAAAPTWFSPPLTGS